MKHKVIGLLAVYGLYSALGLFGMYLRAADSNAPSVKPAPSAPAPVLAAQPAPPIGGIGKFGGIGGIGQIGQFGNPVLARGAQPGLPFGGIGKIGGIGAIGQFGQIGQQVVGIENGTANVVATGTPTPTPKDKTDFVNPKVEPGKVKWHADFDTACKVAAKSGKPVMLFQMMGKLDDQFC